ncbi:MAG: helix-turn-helix domain-containing protein [Roseiarcus sp.]
MASRERIIDSAAKVFGQHGYRLASMELVAQESGLTRQALYHHFPTKEALFRAVIEAVYESAFEAERTAGLKQEQVGKGLADILAAQLEARFRYLFELIKGSAQVEELLSEQQRQTRDLHQSFLDRKLSLIAGAIERACAAGKVVLRKGVTPAGLARSVELAAHGLDLKRADPSAFADLDRSLRLMVAGAIAAAPEEIESRPSRRQP